MSGVQPHPKFQTIKQKSASNLYKMDINNYQNVSDDSSNDEQPLLRYDYFNHHSDYRKEVIVTVGPHSMRSDGDVRRFDIFENKSIANKVLFETKVIGHQYAVTILPSPLLSLSCLVLLHCFHFYEFVFNIISSFNISHPCFRTDEF